MSRWYAQASQIIIMSQPVLAFRNLLQNPAFEHDKTILFDPRNKPMASEEIEYMETNVQQLRGMMEEFFMIGERALPGTKRLMEVLRKIKIYAWADTINRQWSFGAKLNQIHRAQESTDTVEEMIERAKFEDMSDFEQEMALKILAKDGQQAMAMYAAKTHSDDIHFLYERAQRSPAEMDPVGKVVGNLLLFPRSYVEKLAHQVDKLISKGTTYDQKLRAAKVLVAVMLGGYLTGEVYKWITGRKRNPYNPFDLASFGVGGLYLGTAEQLSDAESFTMKALSGDKTAIYALTSLLPEMADNFIPFYAWSLRGLEAATDTKNLDKALLREIYELIDKEYERRGGAYEIERNFVHALRFVFAGSSVDIKDKKETPPTEK